MPESEVWSGLVVVAMLAAAMLGGAVGCNEAPPPCQHATALVQTAPTTPPGSIQRIRTHADPSQITVEWDATRSDVDHYEILRAALFPHPLFLASVAADQREYVDTDVVPGTLYFYWVVEVYTDGSRSPSFDHSIYAVENARFPVAGSTNTISNPLFHAVGHDGGMTIQIQADPDPSVVGYHVWLGHWGETPLGGLPGVVDGLVPVATMGVGQVFANVDGLTNYQKLFVRVTTLTADGESPLASAYQQSIMPSEISVSGPPPAPGPASASPESGYHVRLTWTPGEAAHTADFDHYRIYRAEVGRPDAPSVAAETTDTSIVLPADTGRGLSFCVYAVDVDGNESAADAAPTITLPAISLASKVLVVYNGASGDGDGDGLNDSEEVADHYIQLRGIPASHKLAVYPSVSRYYGSADWSKVQQEIFGPIRDKILALGVENVYYIALSYGVPLYLDDTPAQFDRSLDRWITRVLDVPATLPSTSATGELAGTLDLSVTAVTSGPQPQMPMLYYVQDLPLSVNDFRSPQPQYTSLFDHSFRRHGMVDPASDNHAFLVTRLDGFDVQHAEELVDRALYAEAYLSPEAGYYHGDAYIDRGNGFTLTAPMGDFDDDGDSDELGFLGSGDGDDVSEDQIRAGYPSGISNHIVSVEDWYANFSRQALDFNWAWFRLFLQDRGWTVKVEKTSYSIGEPGSEFVSGESAADGPVSLMQWYVGTYNNNRAFDKMKWAVGAVGAEFSSYSLKHPKDPKSTVPAWVGEAPDDSPWNAGVGANFLYRGITAFSGTVTEPGFSGATRGDALVGYLLEGFPFADAAVRTRERFNSMPQMDFGDPIYRPFFPGRVPAIDTTPPPLPTVEVREQTRGDGLSRYAIAWSIDGLSSVPELAIAHLDYGPTADLGSALDPDDARFEVHHTRGSFELDGLPPGQTVFYQITLRDPSGNVQTTPVASFTTRDPATNLLTNGGFETDADGDKRPDGWTTTGAPAYLGDSFVPNGDFEQAVGGVPTGFDLGDGSYVCDGVSSYTGQCAVRTGTQPVVWTNPGFGLLETGQAFDLEVYARRETTNPGWVQVKLVWKAPPGSNYAGLFYTVGTMGEPENATRPELTTPWDLPEGAYGLFQIRGRVPDTSLGLDHIELLPVADDAHSPVWYDALQLRLDNPRAFSGQGAVGVRGSADTVSQTVPVVAEQTYALHAAIRRDRASTGTTAPHLHLTWLDAGGMPISDQLVPQDGVDAKQWSALDAQVAAPTQAAQLQLELQGSDDPSEWIWFDQVSVSP